MVNPSPACQATLDPPDPIAKLPVHLVSVRSGHHTFHYARRSQRINGQPRVVWSFPLGTTEDILDRYRESERVLDHLKLQTFDFGRLAALHSVAGELHFFDLVDALAGPASPGKLSLAQWLFTIFAGRAHGPLSKSATGLWFKKTFLNLLWTPSTDLSCQNFLTHMDELTPPLMDAILLGLGKRLVELGVVPTTIFWDTSNHSTCMDQWRTGGLVAPGVPKDKRYDRNLFGVALAVSDDGIPVHGGAVPGNASDVTVFRDTIDGITSRLKELQVDVKKMTLVMDRGNNAPDTVAAVLERMHLVGGLKRSEVPDLMEVPLPKYQFLYQTKGGSQLSGYRTLRKIGKGKSAKEMVVVVTHNPRTERRQLQTWERARKKIVAKMAELEVAFAKKGGRGRPMTVKGLTASIHDVVPKQYRGVVDFQIDPKKRKLTWSIPEEKEAVLKGRMGKNVIFSDLRGWETKKIVKTYHKKWVVEDDFRWFHGKLLLPIAPAFHHSDSEERIKVHVFLCVVGMILVRYMAGKLKIPGVKLPQLWNELGRLRVILAQDRQTKQARFMVEEMTAVQAQAFDRLGLSRYLT